MIQPIRPSETTDFIRCPRLWQYKHIEGWSAPPSAWTPEKLMGSAVHEGLAHYWYLKRPGYFYAGPPDAPVANVFLRDWPDTAPPEFSLDGHLSLALKVLDRVLAWIKVNMADAQPVMVEEPLGENGHTTPDLVTREQGDILTVTDWKYTHVLDSDRVRYRLEGIERTHQFLHYCWAVGERLEEPIRQFRKVIIVGNPRIIVRDATFQPTPIMLEQWLTSARQMWEDMAEMRAGRRVAYQREAGCFMYGPKWPCPMYEGCWTCHGNEAMMAQFYTRE